ncbi:MAG: MarR family winged helix-turn-helix transcriptional regulator, partial [Planctomycetota bacterium]
GEHDLSQSLFNVLRIVKGHEPDGVTCQRIGEHLISRGPDVTRLVNRLVDRKYVERVQCNLDLRRRLVRLTKAGQQALDQLTPQVDALHLSQFDGLEDDELRQLIVLLTRLREAAARHEAANNADASRTK